MNYSFYDEMDELDDILNESTDEEIFIESMEELFGYEVTESSADAVALATAVGAATVLGLHEVKKVEKWARSMYHVEVPYKECTHKVIKLTDDTAKELADLFGKTEAWMKHRVSRKCKCHILMHKDDMIYAVLYVATLTEKMQRHNALLEKAFTPNAKRAIGYYSIMLYHKRNIPLSSSGASMLKSYTYMDIPDAMDKQCFTTTKTIMIQVNMKWLSLLMKKTLLNLWTNFLKKKQQELSMQCVDSKNGTNIIQKTAQSLLMEHTIKLILMLQNQLFTYLIILADMLQCRNRHALFGMRMVR